jgi:hypothetical protein
LFLRGGEISSALSEKKKKKKKKKKKPSSPTYRNLAGFRRLFTDSWEVHQNTLNSQLGSQLIGWVVVLFTRFVESPPSTLRVNSEI